MKVNFSGRPNCIPTEFNIVAGFYFTKTCERISYRHVGLLTDSPIVNRLILRKEGISFAGRFSDKDYRRIKRAKPDIDVKLTCGCVIKRLTEKDMQSLKSNYDLNNEPVYELYQFRKIRQTTVDDDELVDLADDEVVEVEDEDLSSEELEIMENLTEMIVKGNQEKMPDEYL